MKTRITTITTRITYQNTNNKRYIIYIFVSIFQPWKIVKQYIFDDTTYFWNLKVYSSV